MPSLERGSLQLLIAILAPLSLHPSFLFDLVYLGFQDLGLRFVVLGAYMAWGSLG